MAKLIFKEKQRFNQWWLYLFLIVFIIFYGISLFDIFSNSALSPYKFFIYIALPLFAIFFILKVNLKSRIDENGVQVALWPMHLKPKHFKWEEIKKIEVIRYRPLKDYGGWGYRFSISGKGKAYNIRGNKGIKIWLRNGKKILIGTQKEVEVQKTIEQYRKTTKENA